LRHPSARRRLSSGILRRLRRTVLPQRPRRHDAPGTAGRNGPDTPALPLMRPLSFDIFCRVVDNFGDIGVCWRLARQLARAPSVNEVRLWVDDLHSFARIQPGVEPCLLRQAVEGVDIVHWTPTAPPPPLTPHDVVIEAFACEPPADFIERMVGRDCVWINLEYLSAEPWVESCHALPSPQAKGLRKFFYFPGFTSATGGLLREPGLL